MAKKARKAAPVEQWHTAETIWDLISSLPRAEKNRLYELVNGDPKNQPVSELLQLPLEAYGMFDKLWGSIKKIWGSSEIALAKRQEVDYENAKKAFEDLGHLVNGLQKKRSMTPASRETLDHFNKLLTKHGGQRGGQMRALEELVTLPSERNKDYVLAYQESRSNNPQGKGDMEAVRQYVKRIRTTHSKRQQ